MILENNTSFGSIHCISLQFNCNSYNYLVTGKTGSPLHGHITSLLSEIADKQNKKCVSTSALATCLHLFCK